MSPKNHKDDEDYYGDWATYEDEEKYDYNDDDDSSQEMVIGSRDDDYWQSQESLLQEILDRYGSARRKMKQEIDRIVETTRETSECVCTSPKSNNCCKCLRQKVVNALCDKGFCATLYTSKWKHTSKLQGGTHQYIEVVACTQSKMKQVHIIIELNFRDEFKMAKASEEYHNLLDQIPETYIGRYEHLNAIVRLLCDAAKRSAYEKKIHIGPWRKRSFMLKKWSAPQLHNQNIAPTNELENTILPLVSCYLQFSSSACAVEAI